MQPVSEITDKSLEQCEMLQENTKTERQQLRLLSKRPKNLRGHEKITIHGVIGLNAQIDAYRKNRKKEKLEKYMPNTQGILYFFDIFCVAIH